MNVMRQIFKLCAEYLAIAEESVFCQIQKES